MLKKFKHDSERKAHVVFGITLVQSILSVSAFPASRGGSTAFGAVLTQHHPIAEIPGSRAGLQPGFWESSGSTPKRKGVGNRGRRVKLVNGVEEGRCTWAGVTRLYEEE